jgi:flagellar assembly protein FliH
MGQENPARPYAFDRIFALSALDAARNPEDQALQLLSLQSELSRLREDSATELARARADGFAAGLAQARSDTEAALVVAQNALAVELARLDAVFTQTEARMAHCAAEVALAAAEVLAARAIDANPAMPVDAAIARVLRQTGFRESLHVHVHPSLAPTLHDFIAARQSTERRALQITIHDDAGLVPGDAHILWDQGGLSLDAAARAIEVREALGLARL